MITLQDLIDRFGEDELAALTGIERHDVINVETVNTAIADAVAEACSYLYAVGLVRRDSVGDFVYIDAIVPKELTGKVCNIARYNLHKDGETETVKDRYDDAVAWLKAVKKDPTMLIGQATTPTTSAAISVMPNPVPSIYGD